ncbi:DUF4351 domain-containing protein [Scytonema hofmannii FACHB-248]|uniref:DUF4351 domain-containing protein n=1 Tax=Scytonema hofmannii FACHB-248 TaxID=1842502 RepID=A0ABR8GZN1_9CYAN|nr:MULTISPECIES: DUF4351 domain-containing protein [Nostocales]MBD2608714.1 DUF4351 domain-containing protein [Scytonema hofmannii FACHB-248]
MFRSTAASEVFRGGLSKVGYLAFMDLVRSHSLVSDMEKRSHISSYSLPILEDLSEALLDFTSTAWRK